MAATVPDGPSEPGKPVGELTYTEASRELDAIVGFFEQRDVDVDQLVARLERATEIVGELDQRLRRTRVQVEQLVPKLAAVLSEPSGDDDAVLGGTGDDEGRSEDRGGSRGGGGRGGGGGGDTRGGGAPDDGHPELF